MIVIDDRLLLDVVVGSATPALEPFQRALEHRELYITGYWYWRLARAIVHPAGGSLSGPFTAMAEDDGHRVLAAMASLSDSIGIHNLRRLVPVMAALPVRALEHLSSEERAALVRAMTFLDTELNTPGRHAGE